MENINKVDLAKDQANIINQSLVDPLFIIELLTKRLIINDKLDKKTQDEVKMIAKQSLWVFSCTRRAHSTDTNLSIYLL